MNGALRLLPSYRLQNLLVEFAALKHVQLQGVYLTLTPGNPALWTGTLFVRKGVFAPAVFRFRVWFPTAYPFAPPVITFASDIFHPLLTPFTTSAHTNASEVEHGSDDGDDRLPPSALSLKYGFPAWAGRGVAALDVPSPLSISSDTTADQLHGYTSELPSKGEDCESMVDVLRYMRSCFEDEKLLDSIPFEAAVNPNAWYAWQSHRGKSATMTALATTSTSEEAGMPMRKSTHGDAAQQSTPNRAKHPSAWNWEGVWAERVKRAVQSSLTEQALYSGASVRDGDIHFVPVDEDGIDEIRTQLHAQVLLNHS